MAFQTQINQQLGAGIPGEPAVKSSLVVESYTLQSTQPNVIGYAFTTSSDTGIAEVGGVPSNDDYNGNRFFAGILVGPKEYALFGTGVPPLGPTLTLPNNVQGDLAVRGIFYVTFTQPAYQNDQVAFSETDGHLIPVQQGSAAPGGYTLIPGAYVYEGTTDTQNGLAVISLNK